MRRTQALCKINFMPNRWWIDSSGFVTNWSASAELIRWTISKLVPDVFGERKDRGMNISGQHITISWMNSGEEETQTLVHDAAPSLPAPD